MLVRLMKYLRGYVKIRVEGYSPERLLNLCNANHILLWGIEIHAPVYEMYLSIRDYKRLRPFAKKTKTKITILEKQGFPFFLHRFRKRKMFFAGLVFSAALVYGLSLFIWNIHFEGNVSQTNEELLAYLETLGVEHGSLKSEIVCETIETSLRTQYPNMLWVSAEMRGTRIIIQVKENTDEDIISKIEQKDTEPVSIAASADGVIESIIVRSGTPLVKAGEEVVAGQLLVEGFYEIKNDAGEIVRYEGVPADADICIRTTEIYSDQFSAQYEEKIYTQKKRLAAKLTLFGRDYEWKPRISWEHYETFLQKKECHITENFYLPVSLELTWYLEYEPKTCIYGENELNSIAEERFCKKFENILQKGVQIIEKDVKIYVNGNLCIVGGTVTLSYSVMDKLPAAVPGASTEALEESRK